MAIRPTILDVGSNPRELQRKLRPLIGKRAADKLETDLRKQAKGLFALGKQHYNFATGLELPIKWRQVVSRSYYGAYNASRAVRLMVNGAFSRDVKDHQRLDQLPDDFPNAATYSNKLDLLRDDRNMCDYDHLARARDLSSSPSDIVKLVGQFVADAKAYLLKKGLIVR